MRSILIATACAAILSVSAQAQSTWTEFNFADQGFTVSFPGDPAIGHMKVKTPAGEDADETLHALRQNDAIYRMTVIDYKDMMVDGNKAIDQAISALRERGSVNLDLPARVDRNRGRQLSITGKDGSHSTVAVFFGDHRLYQIEGTMLASSADPSSGEMIRFQQSLRFTAPGNGFGRGFGGRGFGAAAMAMAARPERVSVAAGASGETVIRTRTLRPMRHLRRKGTGEAIRNGLTLRF